MTSKVVAASPESVAVAEECARLREFKDFLRDVVRDASNSATNADTTRACMTRSSTETYPVTLQEVRAEIIMTVWNHLQTKRCPRYFQLPLLRVVTAEVEQGCRNAKECEFSSNVSTQKSDEPQSPAVEVQYDLVKLQKFVVNNLEKLLTRLTDNTEAGNLQNYAEPKALCVDGEKCNCRSTDAMSAAPVFTIGYIKNKPRKMEDRHICLERFSDLYQLKQNYSFYAVFDGHSGPLAASYATCQLPYLLAARLKDITDFEDVCAYREAFESTFMQADRMFTQKSISSGTTAVCVLLAHRAAAPAHLYVAWVGDSKALLVSPTVSLQLVKSHKPDAPDERKRIENSEIGGTVLFVQGQWRVNGILNVSRSIGDYSVVPAIAEPDFVDVTLTSTHDFIVLGTDGLFDHVSESVIVETTYKSLTDAAQKIEDIPKLLIELAKQGDSQDNITVVIVLLKERHKIIENYKKA